MWYGAGRGGAGTSSRFPLGPACPPAWFQTAHYCPARTALPTPWRGWRSTPLSATTIAAWVAWRPKEDRQGSFAGSSGVSSRDRSQVLDKVGGNFADIQLDDILKAAREGDGVSISVIRDTVKYLAMAVSNMAVVAIEVRGGILQSAGDLLLEPIRQECARRMPPAIQECAKIELSTLGPDASAMGAARFAAGGAALPA